MKLIFTQSQRFANMRVMEGMEVDLMAVEEDMVGTEEDMVVVG